MWPASLYGSQHNPPSAAEFDLSESQQAQRELNYRCVAYLANLCKFTSLFFFSPGDGGEMTIHCLRC
ncbi:hypothetical protein PANT111_150077 [Pantoea brenneri]|uniref:Uncharacterized protein n=1 Tax=Pantoea brenneri TaxID=472694 RepID=A0AAX3J3K9_9GAMM|nr:hypothetical protein PANT111_150077 [Pantoea brenneri]